MVAEINQIFSFESKYFSPIGVQSFNFERVRHNILFFPQPEAIGTSKMKLKFLYQILVPHLLICHISRSTYTCKGRNNRTIFL